MTTLQSITLEKEHYPTQDDAIAFILEKGIVANEMIEFEEAWRVELEPLSGKAEIHPIAKGAIATYIKKDADYEDEVVEVDGSMFPNPTPAELKKIQKFAPKGIVYQAEELRVVELIASDNLVQRSMEAWSLNCLQQMAKYYPGEQLIPDHNWFESDGAMGLVFDAFLEQVEPTPEILDRAGNRKANRKIAATDGVWQLKLKVFFEDGTNALKKFKYRRYYDLSTGGMWKKMPQYLCPHCVGDSGERLNIFSPQCKHDAPGIASFFFADDPDFNFADYILVDGEIYPTEISTVVVGDIPGAMAA